MSLRISHTKYTGLGRIGLHWLVTPVSLLFLLYTMASLNGCDGDGISDPDPNQERGLYTQDLDTIWIVGSSMYHTVMVGVNPVSLVEGRELMCQIRGEGVSTHFRLYDDGGRGRWYDAAGFADTISGDRTAGNGIFTRRVSSLFAVNEGSYQFSFALSGLPPPDTLKASINVRENFEPHVISVEFPDSVYSGEFREFSTVVGDSNGQWDIYEVTLICGIYHNLFHSMSTEDDSLWIFNEPSIAAGLPTGSHPIRIGMADYYLHKRSLYAEGDSSLVWLENLPPVIVDFNGPDTIRLPQEDTLKFFFDVTVADDQTPADI